MPKAPQCWYAPTDRAYLVKAADVLRLVAGLRSFGAAVVGDSAPTEGLVVVEPGKARPPWCGSCDERTRLVSAEHGAAGRCPACHPLRAETRRRPEPEPVPSVEEYQAGVRRVREELRRLRAGHTREIRHGEPVLIGELVDDEGDDEAHPF
jgi:hypothetical protein